jgi:hypothetical protein
MNSETDQQTLRPFYLVLVVWGEQYRNYFLEYSLPSLLAPGNIPFLSEHRPVKYLIATTPEDRDAICKTAVYRELERYLTPVFLELPPKGNRPYWLHAICGHNICCDRAVKDKAYRIFTSPDSVFSDGGLKCLHEAALKGAQAVLKVAMPIMQTERFVQALREVGLMSGESARDSGVPLVLAPRQLAAIGLRAMHGMFRIQEWTAPYFAGFAATPWWGVAEGDGLIVLSYFWDLMLLDYAAVHHDGKILEQRGFDGDYIMSTIGTLETIYLVRDSDEFHIIGWSSLPEWELRKKHGGDFAKGGRFRVSAHGPAFNDMQRELLFMPTYVHSGGLNEGWKAVEANALKALAIWVDPPRDVERYSKKLPAKLQNFVGLQGDINTIRLPWWRRNLLIWRIVSHLVVPFLFADLEPLVARFKVRSQILLRALIGAKAESALLKRKLAALAARLHLT